METVDDIYYEVEQWPGSRNSSFVWKIKPDILKEFQNSLVPGDVVYFQYKSKYLMTEIENYLSTIGCTRTKKVAQATKIVNDRNAWRNDARIDDWWYTNSKPTLVPDVFSLRHKSVFWSSIENPIRSYLDSLRTRISFDYEQYESLWHLFKSKSVDDYRLAGIGIMTIDWTDNMFLLHMLIYQFQSQIRLSSFSNIPNWSNFANTIGIDWKNHHVYSYQLMRLFKDYEITQEQFKLINKLLNQ